MRSPGPTPARLFRPRGCIRRAGYRVSGMEATMEKEGELSEHRAPCQPDSGEQSGLQDSGHAIQPQTATAGSGGKGCVFFFYNYALGPNGLAKFRWIKTSISEDLTRLGHAIAHRVGLFLERHGLLERDAENSYLSDMEKLPDLSRLLSQKHISPANAIQKRDH